MRKCAHSATRALSIYFEDEPDRWMAAHQLTRDEGRRVALNIAKRPSGGAAAAGQASIKRCERFDQCGYGVCAHAGGLRSALRPARFIARRSLPA